jgi:hypothetical protein
MSLHNQFHNFHLIGISSNGWFMSDTECSSWELTHTINAITCPHPFLSTIINCPITIPK